MATLLSAVTSDSTGSGVEHTGPCTAIIHGDSTWGAKECTITLQIADTDTAADYATLAQIQVGDVQAVAVNARGTYWLRAIVADTDSSTSLTMVTTQ